MMLRWLSEKFQSRKFRRQQEAAAAIAAMAFEHGKATFFGVWLAKLIDSRPEYAWATALAAQPGFPLYGSYAEIRAFADEFDRDADWQAEFPKLLSLWHLDKAVALSF